MESGVALAPIADFEAYRDALEARLGRSREVMRVIIHKAQRAPKRIVFPEGEEEKILRASQIIVDERIAQPVLLGSRTLIRERIRALDLAIEDVEIINPSKSSNLEAYAAALYEMRSRKGLTRIDCDRLMKTHNVYAVMMVHRGDADGLVSGLTQHFPETIRPALQIIRPRPGTGTVAGVYMMIFKNQTFFLADPTINIEPTAEQLAEIALLTAETARHYGLTPRVAMLSFSNFGGTKHPLTDKVRRAVEIVRSRAPGLPVDGEMQADIAVVPELLNELYPFNALREGANVLVFPDLTSANVAYKLLARLGGAVAVGPLLTGMNRPVYLLQVSSDVTDIVNMAAMAVLESQDASA
jgi:malate dehydrogenase (oxaloacetate-decarboxylating)(NADP+)